MMILKLLLVLLLALPIFDIQMHANGELGFGEGSTNDYIYSRLQIETVTEDDRLILTGADKEKKTDGKTGVLKKVVLPPMAPPVTLQGPVNRILSLLASAAAAKDVPPEVPPDLTEKFIVALFTKELFEFFNIKKTFKPEDPHADSLKYTDNDYYQSRLESYFECFITLMAKDFAYNKTIDLEDKFLLLLYGEPAATTLVKDPPAEIKFVEEGYFDAETLPPEFYDDGDEFDKMMYKVLTLEIFCSYPFTTINQFASGLDAFAPEFLYPYLKKLYANTKNKRLKRNIVYYLGLMKKYQPMEDLFEILKTSSDNIEKARALYFLTASKFPPLAAYLIDNVKQQSDDVFKSAFINSMGQLGDKKAFPVLVELLDTMEPNYDLYHALLRASVRCLDKLNKEKAEQFSEACKKIYSKCDAAWLVDPPSRFGKLARSKYDSHFLHCDIELATLTADGAKTGARKEILTKLLDIAIALADDGDRKRDAEFKKITQTLFTKYSDKDYISRNVIGSSPLTQTDIDRTLRKFFLSALPEMSGDKPDIIVNLFERMIFSKYENDAITQEAAAVYQKISPERFVKLMKEMLSKELSLGLSEKFINLVYWTVGMEKFLEAVLTRLVKGYQPGMDFAKRHLITVSIFYLAQNGKISPSVLAQIIEHELVQLEKDKERKVPPKDVIDVFEIRYEPESQLARICVEMLGFIKDEKSEAALITLSRAKNGHLRQFIAKTMGNFNSRKVIERLLIMLKNPDRWTRLNAYMSLFRLTGKDHRIDWFFGDGNKVLDGARDYRKILGEKEESEEEK